MQKILSLDVQKLLEGVSHTKFSLLSSESGPMLLNNLMLCRFTMFAENSLYETWPTEIESENTSSLQSCH